MTLHLFIFRRDLRLDDNLGLLAASRMCDVARGDRLAPVFVFNPRQVDARLNPYRCALGIRMMVRCLLGLRGALPQLRFYETRTRDDLDVLEAVLDHSVAGKAAGKAEGKAAMAVHFSSDITPFARERDAAIEAWCERRGVACHRHAAAEYCLIDPAEMPKPYRVFTPFLRRHFEDALRTARGLHGSRRAEAGQSPPSVRFVAAPAVASLARSPGQMADRYGEKRGKRGGGQTPREEALAILGRIRSGEFSRYADTRDDLSLPPGVGTTGLSAYLKFGAVSVREAMAAATAPRARCPELARQMMWRAFYDQLMWHGLGERAWASPGCRATLWRGKRKDNRDGFGRWCRGETGEPLVDAAMRELLETGRMHGRARMVAAVYLTRTLGVEWRLGERFFASRLVDYHPSANQGGWRWAAACGADAMPAFRTLSPARQARAHDREGLYVLSGWRLRHHPKEHEGLRRRLRRGEPSPGAGRGQDP